MRGDSSIFFMIPVWPSARSISFGVLVGLSEWIGPGVTGKRGSAALGLESTSGFSKSFRFATLLGKPLGLGLLLLLNVIGDCRLLTQAFLSIGTN
jgi:hypothetical protein